LYRQKVSKKLLPCESSISSSLEKIRSPKAVPDSLLAKFSSMKIYRYFFLRSSENFQTAEIAPPKFHFVFSVFAKSKTRRNNNLPERESITLLELKFMPKKWIKELAV
jgi:hypothetical protein